MIAIHTLGKNRRGRLAERAPHPFEADRRDTIILRLGFEIERDDVAAARVAARHARVRVGQRAAVARAAVMIDQPGEPRFAIHYGFSIGARTRLPHSVHEPS